MEFMNAFIVLLRIIVSAVFAVAGIAKLADRAGSRKSMRDFGVPKGLAGFFGLAVPVVELIAAAALIPGRTGWYGAALALALLLVFIAGISLNLALGRKPDCHCFGQIHSSPIGWKTLARNYALAAAALVILWRGPAYAQPEIGWWAAIAALAALNLWILIYLLRQNGRLMLRIEALESRLGIEAPAPPTLGLPQGSPAPDFTHEGVTLKSLLAAHKPVLLIFVEPDCTPCQALQPEIQDWLTRHAARLTIQVISETGAKHPVAEAYQYGGTPGAVLINADGTIASAVAAGSDRIRELVRQAALPPAAKKGDPAPDVRLPGIDGKPVDLASFRGSATAILFWNPNCGYCRQVLERVRAWESGKHDPLKLLIVSTGSPDENRGFRSPVVLDPDFATAHAFGVAGTPSAVLVDSSGIIDSEVAAGGENVMNLLNVER